MPWILRLLSQFVIGVSILTILHISVYLGDYYYCVNLTFKVELNLTWIIIVKFPFIYKTYRDFVQIWDKWLGFSAFCFCPLGSLGF